MAIEHIDPHEIEISDLNERQSSVDVSNLVDSIEEEGVIQPPIVRENKDGTYEAFIGQRRILASREVGLETIPVRVEQRDDESALKASIIENADLFNDPVSSADRAAALDKLWTLMGGDGYPSSTELSKQLNVPESTVRTWLEPLREEWQDTEVDPTPSDESDEGDEDESTDEDTEKDVEVESEDETETESEEDEEEVDIEDVADDEEVNDDPTEVTKDRDPDGPDAHFEDGGSSAEVHGEIDDPSGSGEDSVEQESESEEVEQAETEEESVNIVDALGEGKLQKIRQLTGGGKEGEDLAKRVAEEGLTNKEVEQLKKLHDRGNSIDEAIEKVTSSESDSADITLREEVELVDDAAEAVQKLAEERGTTESVIISEAVEYYLEDNDHL